MEKYFIEIKPNSEAFRGHNIGWYTYANSIEEATPENPFVLPAQGDYDYDVTVVTVENTDGKEENVSRVKYTQGPWEIEPTHIDDPAFISDIHAPHQDNPSENGTDPTVATTWYRSVDGQAEANARLISAAPELFEALKTLMEWEGNEAGSYPDPDTQTEANLAWEKAANAITKAVGIKEYFEEN